jgi:hypothetical protein
LYALLGPAALFLLNGVSFIFAGVSEMLIRTASHSSASAVGGRYGETSPKLASILASEGGKASEGGNEPTAPKGANEARVSKAGFYDNVTDGFRYVAAQPGMVGFLITTSVFNALLMPISVLLPVYATSVLGADVKTYGFLLAAIGAGAIAGCAAIGAAQSVLTGPARRRLLITAFAGLGLALMILGQVRSLPAALAILFLTGVLSGAINVLVMSIIQRRTSGEFRGRVLGLHTMMTRVLMPIGLVGGGAVADLTGRNVPLVYAICGGVAMATVVLFASRPATRAFLASS